ncbi:terminase small subunit [Companilactobacillus sp.]|uniref:terminase small subunit n=1 Tax=Companilactobacillus sp. TaxID=2767905 RepID=UPI00262BC15F|nr:terminase small subunit [Companilactobacillus sp.]
MALTPKKSAFVEEYLKDLNATKAAERAGYSAKTAYSQGQRLLKDVEIQELITAARIARSERTQIDSDWVLARLAAEADADVADIYDDNGNLRPVKEWPLIWRKGLVAGIETVREAIGQSANGEAEYSMVQKVRLSDRIKRVELIGKHVNVSAFEERVKQTGTVAIVVSPEDAQA